MNARTDEAVRAVMTGQSHFKLVRSEEAGTVELLRDGMHLWSSDTDPELLEVLGTDFVRDEDIGDVLDYLVDDGTLSEDEADACAIESPPDPGDEWDDEDDDDEDDDTDPDDEDDDDEGDE